MKRFLIKRGVLNGKWATLSFLCGLFVVYTIDRALLGLLALPLQREFGFSDVQLGFLSSSIFWTYAIAVPFAGVIGDRFDRRRVVGLAAVLWSMMTCFAGFSSGFWSFLLLVSVAVVLPQTLYGPAANALIASMHDETRTRAMSCHQAAYFIGWLASGAAVAGVVAMAGTWRAAFFTFGAAGLLMGVVFLTLCGRGEPLTVVPGAKGSMMRRSLRSFFGCPSALCAAVGYVAEVFVMCGFCAWGPKFVAQKFGLSASSAGTGVMFWHYAASFVAILCAGILTDRVVGHYPRVRLVFSMSAMCLMVPSLLLMAIGTSLSAVWAGVGGLGFAMGIVGANQFTNVFDVVPPESRSSAIGFLNVIAGLCGGLAPALLGGLSSARGIVGLEIGFLIFAAVQAVPVLALGISFFFTFNKDRK